jgi:hypothetical protein
MRFSIVFQCFVGVAGLTIFLGSGCGDSGTNGSVGTGGSIASGGAASIRLGTRLSPFLMPIGQLDCKSISLFAWQQSTRISINAGHLGHSGQRLHPITHAVDLLR